MRRYRRSRRGSIRTVQSIPLTQRRIGWRDRPTKWFKPAYDQQCILAKFTYAEKLNFTSAVQQSYYTFSGNDAYDPYIGIGNDSAVNLSRAATYFYKGYCYKSVIRVDLQTLSPNNGMDFMIMPNITTVAGSADLLDSYDRYKANSPGIKLYSCTGGAATACKFVTKSLTKKHFPESDARHNPALQHVLSSSPSTTWKWNLLFATTYGAGNLPQFNLKVKIDYYYVLFTPYNNTM